jgi:hypothetical protein
MESIMSYFGGPAGRASEQVLKVDSEEIARRLRWSFNRPRPGPCTGYCLPDKDCPVLATENRDGCLSSIQTSSYLMSSQTTAFCRKCGASLQADSSYCPKCGASVSTSTAPGQTSQPLDWREQRRQMRAQRRAEWYGRSGSGIGGLVIATILIVAGLGIFFPALPWQAFWGSLLILLGLWIGGLWFLRSRRQMTQQPQ